MTSDLKHFRTNQHFSGISLLGFDDRRRQNKSKKKQYMMRPSGGGMGPVPSPHRFFTPGLLWGHTWLTHRFFTPGLLWGHTWLTHTSASGFS